MTVQNETLDITRICIGYNQSLKGLEVIRLLGRDVVHSVASAAFDCFVAVSLCIGMFALILGFLFVVFF